jgi:hypothetical protein
MSYLNINEAITLGNYSLWAYGQTPIPSDVKYEWIDGLKNDKPVDIQCLVIYEKKRLVFAFRGTDDFKKWVIDAQIAFKDLDDGIKVHSGFYNSVDAIYNQLATIANKSSLPIVTTGHSKGAAESRQFTYRLAKQNHIFTSLSITFGEPRSFNRTGAKSYNDIGLLTCRIIDESDIVCRVPWRCGLYMHVYDEYFMDTWGNTLKNEPWYAHIPSDLTTILKELIRKENSPIADHSMNRYLDRLNQRVSSTPE